MAYALAGKDIDRFLSKIDKSGGGGCWTYTGRPFPGHGYGAFWLAGQNRGAHRISFEIHHGPIPDGLIVIHSCDNPICVNPGHLTAGTYKDNTQQMMDRGRHRAYSGPRPDIQGSGHPMARLSESAVLEIRRRHGSERVTFQALADEYGVDRTTVGLIVRRQTWTHI